MAVMWTVSENTCREHTRWRDSILEAARNARKRYGLGCMEFNVPLVCTSRLFWRR